MHDIESRLREPRRAEPSAALDEHMQKVFAVMEDAEPTVAGRLVPLWQCLVACAACILCTAFLMRDTEVEPSTTGDTPVLYVVYPSTEGEASPFDLTQPEHAGPFANGAVRVVVEEAPVSPNRPAIEGNREMYDEAAI